MPRRARHRCSSITALSRRRRMRLRHPTLLQTMGFPLGRLVRKCWLRSFTWCAVEQYSVKRAAARSLSDRGRSMRSPLAAWWFSESRVHMQQTGSTRPIERRTVPTGSVYLTVYCFSCVPSRVFPLSNCARSARKAPTRRHLACNLTVWLSVKV